MSRISQRVTLAFASLFLFCVAASQANETRSESPKSIRHEADRIDFYQVPLACPAARALGCGSRAKPVLLELESSPLVAEAWLNRTGTVMAVIWSETAGGDARDELVNSVTIKRSFVVKKLGGNAHDDSLKDFLSGKGWYRSSAVDRLSEEEARVIAARLVQRTKATVSMTEDQAKGLERALADVFKDRFVGNSSGTKKAATSIEKLLNAGRKYLRESEIAALRKSINLGLLPLPNEP